MPTAKEKYIWDAVRVIEGRVAALEDEYERVWKDRGGMGAATEISAMNEARHCARLILSLLNGRYHDPYAFARDEWSHGRANHSVHKQRVKGENHADTR